MVLRVEDEYSDERLNELRQFVELNKDFVFSQFIAYCEKVKGVNILRLKLLNNQTTFKHEFNLGILSLYQYQKKIDILNEKLKEQELIKSSINDQFITNVFGTASTRELPPEIIIVYLQEIFPANETAAPSWFY